MAADNLFFFHVAVTILFSTSVCLASNMQMYIDPDNYVNFDYQTFFNTVLVVCMVTLMVSIVVLNFIIEDLFTHCKVITCCNHQAAEDQGRHSLSKRRTLTTGTARSRKVDGLYHGHKKRKKVSKNTKESTKRIKFAKRYKTKTSSASSVLKTKPYSLFKTKPSSSPKTTISTRSTAF